MNYLLLPEQANLLKNKLEKLIKEHKFEILCLDNPPPSTWVKVGAGLFSYTLWDLLIFPDVVKDKLVNDIVNLKNQFGNNIGCYALDPVDFEGVVFKFECYRQITQKDRFSPEKEIRKKKTYHSR